MKRTGSGSPVEGAAGLAEGAADCSRDFRGVDDRAGSAERIAVYLSVLPGLGYGLWAKGTPPTKAAEGGC